MRDGWGQNLLISPKVTVFWSTTPSIFVYVHQARQGSTLLFLVFQIFCDTCTILPMYCVLRTDSQNFLFGNISLCKYWDSGTLLVLKKLRAPGWFPHFLRWSFFMCLNKKRVIAHKNAKKMNKFMYILANIQNQV